MALELYNTRSRRLEVFEPLSPPDVGMYVCGPTVYDYAHVGHARSYITYDVLRRYLTHKGYRVKMVENITDVEDSITERAKDLGVTPAEVAERYAQAYLEDMDALNVLRADHYPKVTDHVPEILDIVEALVDHNCAYTVNGDVLFRVSRTPGYGGLSHQSFEDAVVDEELPSEGREDPLDFIIWREAKEGEPGWDSPWGVGRPGWHIECYVMATSHVGPHLDIHGGGLDLVFPHHESESFIADACGEGEFAKMWVHNGHVTYERRKMSKSRGNFATIREALERVSGEALRYYLMRTHYRETLEFDWSELEDAAEELASTRERLDRLRRGGGAHVHTGQSPVASAFLARFEDLMDNDMDTPSALTHVREFVERLDRENESLNDEDRGAALAALDEAARVLGVLG